MTARPLVRQALAVLALVAAVTAPAAAQKGSKGGHASAKNDTHAAKPAAKGAPRRVAKSSGSGASKARALPPGQAKKRVTHTEAVDVSRRVLAEQGYTVARVERRGDSRVIYYYRGNNGRGKGHGPLQRMVVRPSRDQFAFDGAPSSVLKAVTLRLRM